MATLVLEPFRLKALDASFILLLLLLQGLLSLEDRTLGLELCKARALSLRIQLVVELILLPGKAFQLFLELFALIAHAGRAEKHLALRLPLLSGRLYR